MSHRLRKECLSAVSVEISISDSLQIGQSVTSDENPIEGGVVENKPLPDAEK